jgi:Uma2 family endonuclease
MVEVGILGEDDPLELIDGDLIEMAPQGPLHRGLTARVREQLRVSFGPGHHVQDHSPIDAGANSLPEPDIAVVIGEPNLEQHPAGDEVALALEISVTSQAIDRSKAAVYARAGVREYWNLDVPARRLIVYRQPHPERGEYTLVAFLSDGDTVQAGPALVEVSDLLP